jgi:hypothetical protein
MGLRNPQTIACLSLQALFAAVGHAVPELGLFTPKSSPTLVTYTM